MTDRLAICPLRPPPLYHGWLVVVAAFLVAFFGFGFGFYGPGLYLLELETRHGWSVAGLAPAITGYYALGAILLFFAVGPLFDRYYTGKVLTIGVTAMASGLLLLTVISRRWEVYAAFAVMAVGWATMSGAAINIIVAPWFEKRRGMAVSWSLSGANVGGIVVVPLLTSMTARLGFQIALQASVAAMVVLLLPIAMLILRPKRADECDRADRHEDATHSSGSAELPEAVSWAFWSVLRSARFSTISLPFALALIVQVGLLTHQLAYLSPLIGAAASGWAVSLTASAALFGRTVMGLFVDRINRRTAACGNFLVQAVGVAILAVSRTAPMLYLGCVLLGLGIGNTTSLPSLIVHQEFPSRLFARLVSLVVAINQFTFAFGPILIGYLRQLTGGYMVSLIFCVVIEVSAATIVILPVLARSLRNRGSSFGTASSARAGGGPWRDRASR
ncbi:MAG: MFS transporter [Alphaproteobacteria bacterium]|nr:MFS transporter [Alphaproteobacteria bacterium]